MFINDRTYVNGGHLRIAHNYYDVKDFWEAGGEQDAVVIRAEDDNFRTNVIYLTLEQTRALADDLVILVAQLEAAKPVKPKNSEVIQGYGTGVVFELDGDTGHGKWIRTETGALWLNGHHAGKSKSLSFFDSPYWTPRITTL